MEFADPADADQVFRCDLTWLTSRWACIFGQGCAGIYADRPTTAAAPWARTSPTRTTSGGSPSRRAADRGTVAVQGGGEPDGWVELEQPDHVAEGEQPGRKTRVVDGACIFLNRPGFPAGAGCALHLLALRQGRPYVETKPDVCWQLPLRRQFRTVTRTDETTYTEVTIGEYGRDGWGPGGHDLDWYCTSNTEAHHGRSRSTESNRDELIALMGSARTRCWSAVRGVRVPARRLMRHPADPAASSVPRRVTPSQAVECRRATMRPCIWITCPSRPGPRAWTRRRERLGAQLGATFADGGFHPRFGTRNPILPLTDGHYLEVVDVLDHPAADKAPFGQAVRARSEAGRWLAGLGGRRR